MQKHYVARGAAGVYLRAMKKLPNITRDAAGWSVRVVRHGSQHSKYFRFSQGGVRASRAAAIIWRDQKIEELGARQWHTGPRKLASNNTSGVAGVSKNRYGRWVATWQDNGRQRFQTFKTKKEAVKHRRSKLA